MARVRTIAKTVLGSAAIAAMPTAAALAVPTLETENNNTFPGQSATAGVTYQGNLCTLCPPPTDPFDFYHYIGLPAGGTFDLTFDPAQTLGGDLTVGRYTSGGPPVDSVSSTDAVVHLTGSIPGSGGLTFGVTLDGGFEGYLITLNVTPPAVAAPPALALLTAGLTALSFEVARRRRRR